MNQIAEELRKVQSSVLGAGDSTEPEPATLLATALRWTEDSARVEPGPDSLPAGLVKSLVFGQPAAVFFVNGDYQGHELVDLAARFAYHATIHWGVVSNMDELLVFNSHWVSGTEWYYLPGVPWDAIPDQVELFEALTPEGVIAGAIDTLAAEVKEPDHLLLPVDDALVDRLDHWRDETLRHAIDYKDVDEKLQTLFAQLFILRSIEDRRLMANLPPLSTVLNAVNGSIQHSLGSLFDIAEKQIQSELFRERVMQDIPELVIEGVIKDLYTPAHLPFAGGSAGAKYDFSWIEADVLGRAYEKYLSNLLVPTRIGAAQLHLFDQPLREARRVSVQKSQGVYYTPQFLVRYVTERTLSEFRSVDENTAPERVPRVADLSCGSGSFLTAAADILIRQLSAQDSARNWARELVQRRLLIGVDTDPRAVTLARLTLWLRFAEEPNPLPLPHLQEIILVADSLTTEAWSTIPDSYDVILGNPPFISTAGIPDRKALAKRFVSARGRFDYAYVFLELALDHLSDDGVLGLVLPSRLSVNRDAAPLRSILTRECNVLSLVDFGSHEIFIGTKSHILVLIARKKRNAEDATSVRVIGVDKLPDRFPGVSLYEAERTTEDIRTQFLTAHHADQPSGDGPWLLLSRAERKARVRLEGSGPYLNEIAGIFQGIKTGANDLYIVRLVSDAGGKIAEVENGLGDRFLVEKSFLRPVALGGRIQKYGSLFGDRFMLYAYQHGQAMNERELSEIAPKLWKYFKDNEDLLSIRSSLSNTGKAWFELIRQRNRDWLERPKLLIKDLVTQPSFALDLEGDYYLTSGSAVVPIESADLLPLLGYLNSAVSAWLLRSSMPTFRSGFQKLEPRHLEFLPVPEILVADTEPRDRIAELVAARLEFSSEVESGRALKLEKEIDTILCSSLGISYRLVT